MAHGLRSRIGVGVLVCSGLVGCMNDDRKPLGTPPMAKGTGPAARPNMPTAQTGGNPAYGTGGAPGYGMQPAAGLGGGGGGVQQVGGARPMGGTPGFGAMPSRNDTGTMTPGAIPGNFGSGPSQPIPGAGVIPAGGPAASNYFPPAGGPGRFSDPPVVGLTDPGPMPSPPGPPSGYAPPVGPTGDVQPPSPYAPVAPVGGPPAGYR